MDAGDRSDTSPQGASQRAAGIQQLTAELRHRQRADEHIDWAALGRDHPELTDELEALRQEFVRRDAGAGRATDSFFHRSASPEGPGDLGRTTRAFSSGDIVDDYRLDHLLGVGGMGQVWEAEQLSTQRRVALKLLRSGSAQSLRQLERFRREAEAGERISHPGLAVVHGFGEADGCPFIAQELVGGGVSLRSFLDGVRAGDLPAVYFSRITELFARIADALQAAHEAGIIHRDLKPENILITTEQQPKIVDFGLAKLIDRDSLSRTGDFAGTYHYMSPEQAVARRMGIDHRTDVFSLGATLYEALTLVRPFEGDTSHQITEKVLYFEPTNPRQIRSRVPRDLAVICLKALEKRRGDRYQTMREFAEDLRRTLAEGPIRAKPPAWGRLLRRWVVRHPTASAVTGLSLTAAVIIASLYVESEQSAALARTEKANVLRLSAFQQLEDLRQQAASLWPPEPRLVPRLDTWQRHARELVAGLEPNADGSDLGHRHQLRELRDRALAWTQAERESDQRSHPKLAELTSLRETVRKTEQGLEAWNAALVSGSEPSSEDRRKVAKVEADLERVREAVTGLEAETSVRRTWNFADEDDSWWHNRLEQLVAEIEAFADPETGLMQGFSTVFGWGVQARLDFASGLEKTTRTGEVARRRWAEAIASIGDREQSPLYRGMSITPQPGLLPIGRDPATGLWEFWHAQSGDEPERNEQDGQIAPTVASGLVLVLIPGGTFMMGAQGVNPEEDDYDPFVIGNETNLHEVTIPPFFLSKYEMTQGQWLRIAAQNPSKFPVEEGVGVQQLRPVESVSWDDCMEIARRLDLTLPTEAQWEFAARAGTRTTWWTGNDKQSLLDAEAANIADVSARVAGFGWSQIDDTIDDGYGGNAPVHSMKANPFGLHHVHGNVNEWCLDGYELGDTYEMAAVEAPLVDPAGKAFRVARGGAAVSTLEETRVAARFIVPPWQRNEWYGLRPAREIVQ